MEQATSVSNAAISVARVREMPVTHTRMPAPQHRARRMLPDTMIRLEGGAFWVSADLIAGVPSGGETEAHEIWVHPFAIDRCSVSNLEFAVFVAATGYRTDAERLGNSFAFDMLATGGWRAVEGASWRAPDGPGSSIAARLKHPVVHVSWNDAAAYARWAGKRLPTEAEWEYAARGGTSKRVCAWSADQGPGCVQDCRHWQGRPATSFLPNGYGLYNMPGNIWEWCGDVFKHGGFLPELAPNADRLLRGGADPCDAAFCSRCRVAARTHAPADSSNGHMGFRCVRDVP